MQNLQKRMYQETKKNIYQNYNMVHEVASGSFLLKFSDNFKLLRQYVQVSLMFYSFLK